MIFIILLLLAILGIPLAYWILLALASVRFPRPTNIIGRLPTHRFVIAIPAHNEANVIETTVKRLHELDYPTDMYSIHIVADHCSDDTAELARRAGAQVHERKEGPRGGKGGALSWLFKQILDGGSCDAVVIFDADTQVDPQFLRLMDTRLAQGDQVIQGQHVIRNPKQGWFAALTWAMFLIDNRYQNLGRSNLGWSAKHMGDSICFKEAVLRKMGWGEGLTEDFQLRQRLLLEGIRITYEPSAKGYGEAPRTWTKARTQRARWLRGTTDASQRFGARLLVNGFRHRNAAMLDGAMQAYFPSYSTLSLLFLALLMGNLILNRLNPNLCPMSLIFLSAFIILLLFVYPLFGLFLERAPLKAYIIILTGPIFIIWRTWLAVTSRFKKRKVTWIRTSHGEK
jgi:cellulose synthase/poly-beta-1,6-N-acetylglucosamine synthase-like glycosyltransferase